MWGEPVGPGGYLDAELLDGRRGLVPSHFAQRIIGDDLLEFHHAVLTTLKEDDINTETFAADVQRLTELAEMSEGHEDDGNEGEQGKNGSMVVGFNFRPLTYIVSSRDRLALAFSVVCSFSRQRHDTSILITCFVKPQRGQFNQTTTTTERVVSF